MPSAARSVADSLVLFSADVEHRRGALPDLDRVVLDPAGLRQDLFVFELMAPDLGAVVVEDHAPRAGGALVDGGDELGQLVLPPDGDCQSSIMVYMARLATAVDIDIDRMPRGGPGRLVPRPAAADRSPGVPRPRRRRRRARKRSVIRALEWTGEVVRQHREVRAHRARRGGRRARPQDPRARRGPRRAVPQAARMASHRRADGHRHRAAIGGGDRGRRPRRASAGDGARDGRHRDRRRRRAFRPGGVRAVVSPPAAVAGVAGVRRGHPGGRQAADHRPAAAAVAAAPRCGWRRCCRSRRWCRSCTTA